MTRIERLRNALGDNFDCAIVQDVYNRGYLTGFRTSSGTLLVTKKHAYLIVDFRYIEAAREKSSGAEVVLMGKLYEQLADLMKKEGVKKAAVEDEMSLGDFERLKKGLGGCAELVCGRALSKEILSLRAIKDDGEISAIKAAQKITDDAFEYILGFIKPGMRERDVAAELEYFMRRNGADGLAFNTICVAGKKTSLPHGEPDDNIIKSGDFVTMDYGALVGGYCSDMTRTIAVGKADDEMKRVYSIVLRAHLETMDAARAGIKANELDKKARDIIYSEGFEGCFGHGLGHCLGLQIHEEPRANQTCEEILCENMVITVEPGIYLEGKFGVRIENMARLEKNGAENLTKSPRELIIL
ncbi:MAG: aminopeptidase P family protein [Oscillospiraceae bacterium]